MSLPVRHLPVLQNWDCQGCSNCCHEYEISVTDAERERLMAQGWEKDAEIGGLPLFVRSGSPWKRRYRLNHRANGACIFLSKEGRCRIHERFGAAAKPLPCRLYPFVLIPAGEHWRVALRFACPAAASNRGRPLGEHRADLAAYAGDLERQAGGARTEVAPPPLRRGQVVDWPDLLRFLHALLALLRDRDGRFEQRLRKCLALANVCLQARFDEVKGSRLVEFLDLVRASLEDEVPVNPAVLAPPSRVGRILFRQALAVYVRKDQGPDRNLVRSRLGLLGAAWRFARGKGRVPRLHAWLPDTTFEQAEEPLGLLPPAAEEILERYYLVKVNSLQFCGASNFGMPFWEGFQALALTLPAILWITRLLRDLPREEAVVRAIGMVDRNFGFNPILGLHRQRLALRMQVRRGDLDKLIAWYSR
jgi:lysine-N-methylase